MELAKSTPSWGKTVELLRRIREWRQDELAERASVSLPTLSAYETDKREPTDEARAAIESALGVAGWMDEAQAHLGSLRRAMERPFDLGGALEREAAERAAQVEILLRAGVARLLGRGDSDHDPEDSHHDARSSPDGPEKISHDRESFRNDARSSPHGPNKTDHDPENSPRAPRKLHHGPRSSAHGPKNPPQGP